SDNAVRVYNASWSNIDADREGHLPQKRRFRVLLLSGHERMRDLTTGSSSTAEGNQLSSKLLDAFSRSGHRRSWRPQKPTEPCPQQLDSCAEAPPKTLQVFQGEN